MQKIYFHSADRKLDFPQKKHLKNFIGKVFEQENTDFSQVHYIFCSDDYLLKINRQFLKHDYYTDIVTFNLAGEKKPLEGEIYISLDRVEDNARTLKQLPRDEKLRVILHGILHLCGYGDKSPAESKQMRAKENFYMKAFGNFSG